MVLEAREIGGEGHQPRRRMFSDTSTGPGTSLSLDRYRIQEERDMGPITLKVVKEKRIS